MTEQVKQDSDDSAQTRLVFDLWVKSVSDYEEQNPTIHIKDRIVFNAALTMLYNILYYTHGNDVVEIRKALEHSVEGILKQARKNNLVTVSKPKLEL